MIVEGKLTVASVAGLCIPLQVARELVAKLIRDKDLGDFRIGKAEFGSKLGGNSLDVRTPFVIVVLALICSTVV